MITERDRKQRQDKIVSILKLLHEGGSFEEAKALFNQEFDGVDVSEITSAERALIKDGLDPREIQRLCNIHAAVFKGAIEDIHQSNLDEENPGHPIYTMKLENKVLNSLLTDEVDGLLDKLKTGDWRQKDRLIAALLDLQQLDKHYTRKELLFFPYMERYGITAPPKVMWGVDDDIRALIKDLAVYARSSTIAYNPLIIKWEKVKAEIEEMIFKEEYILFPMILEVFSLKDWEQIAKDSYDIGFSFIAEPMAYNPSKETREKELAREPLRLAAIAQAKDMTDEIASTITANHEETESELTANTVTAKAKEDKQSNYQDDSQAILFETGSLALQQLVNIFKVLPVDLTFVDHEDKVRFYSEGKERVFPRTNSVLGREVVNCHPPKSMSVVQAILDDFHSGKRDDAEFWIDMRCVKVYIRYFAVRDDDNQYLGCLEVTEDITHIQKLDGQKRLLD